MLAKITTKPHHAPKNKDERAPSHRVLAKIIESKRKRMKQMGRNFTWELVIHMARQTRNTHTRPHSTPKRSSNGCRVCIRHPPVGILTRVTPDTHSPDQLWPQVQNPDRNRLSRLIHVTFKYDYLSKAASYRATSESPNCFCWLHLLN